MDVLQLQPNKWYSLNPEGRWRTCKIANTAVEGRGKKKKKRQQAVSPISNAMLRLHQIACIFRIHAHGVFRTNLSPKIRLERVFLVGLTWVEI